MSLLWSERKWPIHLRYHSNIVYSNGSHCVACQNSLFIQGWTFFFFILFSKHLLAPSPSKLSEVPYFVNKIFETNIYEMENPNAKFKNNNIVCMIMLLNY